MPTTVQEPWHLQWVNGDVVPARVLAYEASLKPPPTVTPPIPPDLEEESDTMKPSVCKKDGKSACWLIIDRHTRAHISSETQLTQCLNAYGDIILLSANQDLNAIAPIVVGTNPGDV